MFQSLELYLPAVFYVHAQVWCLCHLTSQYGLTTHVFCLLRIKGAAELSILTKLWIVCLQGTLSSQNLRLNFYQLFPAELYFTQMSKRNVHCSKVYCTMTTRCSLIVTESKRPLKLATATQCRQIIYNFPRMNSTACIETYCCHAVHKHYRSSGIPILRQNLNDPRSRQCTGQERQEPPWEGCDINLVSRKLTSKVLNYLKITWEFYNATFYFDILLWPCAVVSKKTFI
jgi:hypothetical protein